MTSKEAFENVLHNICDNLRDDGVGADIGEYINRIMQACEEQQAQTIAELVEALEQIVLHDDSTYYVCEKIATKALAKLKGK